jgi:hypothetical protein
MVISHYVMNGVLTCGIDWRENSHGELRNIQRGGFARTLLAEAAVTGGLAKIG